MAVTITIDNLEDYDITELERILGKTLFECDEKVGVLKNRIPDDDDYFHWGDLKACYLTCFGYPKYFITQAGDLYRECEQVGIKRVNPHKIGGKWTYDLAMTSGGRRVMKRYMVSRLVATCFCNNYDSVGGIGYKDGNADNYSADNLHWEKRSNKKGNPAGRKGYPIEMLDLSGRVIGTYKTITECCNAWGFCKSNLCYVINGKKDTAYGYKFRKKIG